jgi:hypothetical protein
MGMKPAEPITTAEGIERLKEAGDHLAAGYQMLCGYEWRRLEDDLPVKAAMTEARHKALDGFSIVELARKRLEELAAQKDKTVDAN